ncbi:glutamate--tRNA ligase [Haematospirillum jordaniae]|uniref:Glutamate--tRNA ligase n=1 Tax=Haematospirillum jordaniae TaxID=1549855 RepID=A0A143DEL9_9PROT|nr:glutamate--tRNA ligase [Haematospirillum jordaniae]AMW34970.1 glutamine--tRNA ligase [Haematospirillum jordaniae]NKD44301.1 glutamate--tRNA ligase [Haematospirillum jordaniae]NKD56681.1 glutamate--tRNA ligase [Haematospirillum jordaniae]NKD58739.1 glutamate--tRNA ligase [Haematospirillum jordaniae]NKD66092.1 glutamate--tRNA ligase [Haematospirillum jordaniae]
MSVRVRFAPSPTGALHMGNIRLAVINFLLAGGDPGRFVLRYDDTDQERSRPEFIEGIARDLRWLGIEWGQEFFQSRRLDLYVQARDRLIADGRLYPCYETPEELEYMRNRQRARGLPPVYDRSALALTSEQKETLEQQGRRPHWRFRLDPGEIRWTDLVRGECVYNAAHLADPVVIREDGSFLYLLPSVVDDVAMGITHVVRGEDHVTNTAVQIQMFQALGGNLPAFAHLPLLVGADGHKLSKRSGSLSVAELRDKGVEPLAVHALLARLGSSEAVEPVQDVQGLIQDFDLGRFGRGAPRLDEADLMRLTEKLVHGMGWDQVAQRLRSLGCDLADESFWLAVRPNVQTVADTLPWYRILHGPMVPVCEDAAFLTEAASLLPPEPWDEQTWKQWTGAVSTHTGRKGKALFMPLRLALTGLDHGPELKVLLPLLGRGRVLQRLGCAA